MPGNTETIIDYDCVPSYSHILAAQIVDMNDNIIIPETSLKTGMIDRQHYCWIQNMLVMSEIFLRTVSSIFQRLSLHPQQTPKWLFLHS